MSDSSSPKRTKTRPEPRDLPERAEEQGDPFEQLNATEAGASEEPRRGGIQPRNLPKHEADLIHEAARLLREGDSREEVARKLEIEPIQLRSWETAYSNVFQRDLNEGEYHDTDAQLRDLDEDEKEKFQGNWEQVTEKATQRRIKVSPFRAKLMEHPATRWMFRGEHGDIDYGTVIGILVALVGLGVALKYVNASRVNPTAAEDDAGILIELDEITEVQHDPDAAAQAVIDFHKTTTWEEKLAFVSNPDSVRPLMEDWYTRHPDDVNFDHITFGMDQPIEEEGREFITIGLIVAKDEASRANARNFVMLVERMDNNEYKVEWETSSGYQPISMEDLKAQKPTEPVELRLTLAADDFFNFGFQADQYVCFKGTMLGQDDPIFVYGKRTNAEIMEVASMLAILPSGRASSSKSPTPPIRGPTIRLNSPKW